MAHYKVGLTYFKLTGKYYSFGEMKVNKNMHLQDIWEQIIQMRDAGNLPGLRSSAAPYDYYIISVEVPGHPHEHPHLIVP